MAMVPSDQYPDNVPGERVYDFNIYAPPECAADFHNAWKTLQASGVPDLIWTPQNGGHWIATRAEIIAAIFPDYRQFSSRVLTVPKSEGEFWTAPPIMIDPPKHRRYRNVLNSSFSPAAVKRLEPSIRRLSGSLIETVRLDGSCEFMAAYAERLPIKIFLEIMDLPEADVPYLKRVADHIQRSQAEMSFVEGFQRLVAYMTPFVESRTANPRDDLISRIVNTSIDGHLMSKKDAVEMCVQVMLAGLDTVVNALGFFMLFLAQNPGHRQQLIADPQLIPAAIEELFRRYAAVTTGREVVADTSVDGITLKRGDMVLLPTFLFGLDERRNEHSMDVDFQRTQGEHRAFGGGVHMCPGSFLARTELRITMEEWLARIPEFAVAPGGNIRHRAGITGALEALPLIWEVNQTRSVDVVADNVAEGAVPAASAASKDSLARPEAMAEVGRSCPAHSILKT
jgi:cytochrome P450